MKFSIIKVAVLCFFFFFQFSIIKAAPLPKNTGVYASQNNDLSPKQVIIKFLKWYRINLHKANSLPILIKDSADNFMINKSASNKYLALLKSSGCLSLRYIAYWKSFFEDKAIGLKANPVQSDIPEDFDLDFVLITQEPGLVLDHIDEMKFQPVSVSKNYIVMGVTGPEKNAIQYNFELHKNAAGWQIDYIATSNID